jgi:hypothetical protein
VKQGRKGPERPDTVIFSRSPGKSTPVAKKKQKSRKRWIFRGQGLRLPFENIRKV